MALGLADEKAQALTEASLLSSHVDDPEAITAGSYNIEILGTDLAAKKPGKAYTVRRPPFRLFPFFALSLPLLAICPVASTSLHQ